MFRVRRPDPCLELLPAVAATAVVPALGGQLPVRGLHHARFAAVVAGVERAGDEVSRSAVRDGLGREGDPPRRQPDVHHKLAAEGSPVRGRAGLRGDRHGEAAGPGSVSATARSAATGTTASGSGTRTSLERRWGRSLVWWPLRFVVPRTLAIRAALDIDSSTCTL